MMSSFVDGGYVEDGVAYFTNNNEPLFSITGIGGGGGGGGGAISDAVLTVSNTTGWLSKTVSEGASCVLSFTWSSLLDGLSTGDGTLKITCNGVARSPMNIKQGAVTVDVSTLISSGSNIVKLIVSDVYGTIRTINFNITVVSLSLTSTFNALSPFSSSFDFSCIPTGSVSKTIYYYVDDSLIGSRVTQA